GIMLAVIALSLAKSMVGGDISNLGVALLSIPLILLVGLNVGMWLLRGFRTLKKMRFDPLPPPAPARFTGGMPPGQPYPPPAPPAGWQPTPAGAPPGWQP